MKLLSQEVLRDLFLAAPDAMVVVDAAGEIVLLNDRAAQLLGWSPRELVGAPVEALVPEMNFARHIAHRARYHDRPVDRPMGSGVPLPVRRKDGTSFHAEISLRALSDGADGVVVLAAIREASDEVGSEVALRHRLPPSPAEQSHRLESLGQLAGGVAHDFNNLLGVILNYATLVARRVDDPEVLADVAEISAAADRAAGLTRQLMTFASRDEANPEPLEVNTIVDQLAAMLTRTLGDHIELRLALSSSRLIAIADRHQLEQIVINLVLNARDAMPTGGIVTVATGSSVRSDGASPADAILTVTDEGTGMSSEVAARAFEPFFTTKPVGAGTGLGLATVYGIVQQSGGTVAIESVEGAGTTVRVSLRGSAALVRAPMSSAEARVRGGSERILLVEDEETLRIGTARVLSASGYDVLMAVDGIDALELVASDPGSIDLVIADIAMPRLRGDELASRLREARPDLPVILMSGYASGDARGFDRLLTKPVVEDVLLRTIQEVLDGR